MIRKLLRKIRKDPRLKELETLKRRGLQLGEHVDIFSDYPFDSIYPGLIRVGDYVTISSNVKILAHDASMGYGLNGVCKVGIVDIGNRVFIGQGVTILCDVRIGDDCIIGAGSVVTHDIPAGSVCAGNPARVIKKTEDFLMQHEQAMKNHTVISRSWKEFRYFEGFDWDDIRSRLKFEHGYIKR